MPYVAAGTRFPDFQQSKDFFRDGIGSAPEFPQLTDAPAAGGGPSGSEVGLSTPPDTGVGATTPTQETFSTAPAGQTLQDPTPGVGSPYDLGYQQTGTLEERLYDPLTQAGEVGGEQLTEFADMFKQEAGPSRTFEGIGAQQQLQGAITGESPTSVGKALVGAQYTGPAGLDPAGSAYLQDLARQMQSRQQMLQTGGGTTTAVQQSVAGLTPGEARYQAKSMFAQPGYREGVAERTAGVGEFQGALDAETQAALDYAAQRTGEEQDIASASQGYLGGYGEAITGDIQQSIEAAEAENLARTNLYGQIQGAGTPQEQVALLQQLQGRGGFQAEGDTTDPSAFLSEHLLAGQQNEALMAEIMAKYPELADIDPLGRGLSGSGRGTLTYTGKGPEGEEVDYRSLYDAPTRRDLTLRQRELEEQFDPVRMAEGRGAEGAAYNPLYGGGPGFSSSQEVTNYLGFDPGIKPSRANISTAEQKQQFNNIQEMLGNLDRIAEAQNPFQAAMIYGQIDQYLSDEEAAFEAHKGEMSEEALTWKSQVKKLRKKAKQAEKMKDWGEISGYIGGGIGAIAGFIGGGGPIGGVRGYQAGSTIGAPIGRELAR